jgi:hypothetical protein
MKKKLLMVAIFLYAGLQMAMAQGRPVKGRVLDETGEGLAGASITVKGTTTGTITDVDGNFSLDVPDDKKTLLINGVGYAQQEIQAGDGDNVLSVKMATATTEIKETIVTALGIKKEKKSLGYGNYQKRWQEGKCTTNYLWFSIWIQNQNS